MSMRVVDAAASVAAFAPDVGQMRSRGTPTLKRQQFRFG
eukprot:CAMPEP_0206458238 /NCGR_PEP_ID=MMETSP0324_2-20121206/23447_1 /ASSEMBLY_ACC=CAM_ASM_000836 /TAXON_ID=2866 /ORGANISM="Crypthecodinium cohnii, Strain Seligo" /LENGTH=38 /DNA_ID= /DNA_START= /DNA_END= /DNA_ORIENTATION=